MRPQQLINIGAAAGDGTGDPAREAFDKVNDNFTELYEQTTAIDKTVFSGTLIDAFLYDTSKDSDGGAWRKRCSHTSWENETLSGNWLGSAANEAEARGLGGAVTGSLYYDTNAAVFRTLNAGSGVTQVYRGNTRQFPAQVLITIQSGRVTIWDITQAGCPMWIVWETGAYAGPHGPYLASSDTAHCVAAMNGVVVIGKQNDRGVCTANFVADRYDSYRVNADAHSKSNLGISPSNTLAVYSVVSTVTIASNYVNDAAITVLPNAPVDVATGLPVPTIAVATNAGVSVIKDDGNVWDFVVATYPAKHVWFDKGVPKRLFSTHGVSTAFTDCQLEVIDIPSSDVTHATAANRQVYDIATTPAILGDVYSAAVKGSAIGSTTGVSLVKRNDASIAAGMVAYMTKDYNSGWQVGAIKGAWLADTLAETLTGTELVTNGTFDTDTTGWTATNGAILSVVSNRLRIENGAANFGGGSQGFATTVGKQYVVTYERYSGSPALLIGTSAGSQSIANTNSPTYTFTATATTTYITPLVPSSTIGAAVEVDNISCRPADADRSIKGKGLQVFGSLTKAAVASGAQLMGYSGFSAANFFEQPYNSDLDFGTGDFCVIGWVVNAANRIINRVAGGFGWNLLIAGGLVRVYDHSVANEILVSTVNVASGAHLIVFMRASGVAYLNINGKVNASAASVHNYTLPNAVVRFGLDTSGVQPLTGQMALWRAGATAPTAEQIRHIYETERPLFKPNAQCCLAGTSNAVTALAYDDETDLLHVGTSYGRSAFKGLVRVASEATGVGAITALSAGAGIVAQAGATAVDVYVPAYLLREELLRDAEQMAKFGQNLIAHDFTATASQTDFVLPVGWEIVAVYQQGVLKRETTSWTRRFDGFLWKAVLGTGATVGDWISILAKRV